MFLLWFPVQCINWCCLCLTSKMFSVYENIDHRDFIRDNHWLPQITQHINSYFPWWTLSDPYMSLIQTVSNLNPPPPSPREIKHLLSHWFHMGNLHKLWKDPNIKTNWGVPFSGGPKIPVIAKERSFHLKTVITAKSEYLAGTIWYLTLSCSIISFVCVL